MQNRNIKKNDKDLFHIDKLEFQAKNSNEGKQILVSMQSNAQNFNEVKQIIVSVKPNASQEKLIISEIPENPDKPLLSTKREDKHE